MFPIKGCTLLQSKSFQSMDGKPKTCPICERPEGKNERYWYHYGALCCLRQNAYVLESCNRQYTVVNTQIIQGENSNLWKWCLHEQFQFSQLEFEGTHIFGFFKQLKADLLKYLYSHWTIAIFNQTFVYKVLISITVLVVYINCKT